MATATVHAANVQFDADRRIARWRPLVQWLLAIPHLAVANALSLPSTKRSVGSCTTPASRRSGSMTFATPTAACSSRKVSP
jgi:hypothetical protein